MGLAVWSSQQQEEDNRSRSSTYMPASAESWFNQQQGLLLDTSNNNSNDINGTATSGDGGGGGGVRVVERIVYVTLPCTTAETSEPTSTTTTATTTTMTTTTAMPLLTTTTVVSTPTAAIPPPPPLPKMCMAAQGKHLQQVSPFVASMISLRMGLDMNPKGDDFSKEALTTMFDYGFYASLYSGEFPWSFADFQTWGGGHAQLEDYFRREGDALGQLRHVFFDYEKGYAQANKADYRLSWRNAGGKFMLTAETLEKSHPETVDYDRRQGCVCRPSPAGHDESCGCRLVAYRMSDVILVDNNDPQRQHGWTAHFFLQNQVISFGNIFLTDAYGYLWEREAQTRTLARYIHRKNHAPVQVIEEKVFSLYTPVNVFLWHVSHDLFQFLYVYVTGGYTCPVVLNYSWMNDLISLFLPPSTRIINLDSDDPYLFCDIVMVRNFHAIDDITEISEFVQQHFINVLDGGGSESESGSGAGSGSGSASGGETSSSGGGEGAVGSNTSGTEGSVGENSSTSSSSVAITPAPTPSPPLPTIEMALLVRSQTNSLNAYLIPGGPYTYGLWIGLLQQNGAQTLHVGSEPGGMTLGEQIRTVRRVRVLVTDWGSGMANGWFMRPNSLMFVLVHSDRVQQMFPDNILSRFMEPLQVHLYALIVDDNGFDVNRAFSVLRRVKQLLFEENFKWRPFLASLNLQDLIFTETAAINIQLRRIGFNEFPLKIAGINNEEMSGDPRVQSALAG